MAALEASTANTVLAEFVTELGVPTTVEDSYRDYMGKRLHEVVAAIEKVVGRALPTAFAEQDQDRFKGRAGSKCRASSLASSAR